MTVNKLRVVYKLVATVNLRVKKTQMLIVLCCLFVLFPVFTKMSVKNILRYSKSYCDFVSSLDLV